MLSLDKKLTVVLYNPERFEFDLDFILAASVIHDDITVLLTKNTKNYIDHHKVYAKQFSGLSEFGVNTIIGEGPLPSPVLHLVQNPDAFPSNFSKQPHMMNISNPNLINYDELVDLVVECGATQTWY
jgi:hypothetical protein